MNFYFEAAKTLDRLDAKEGSIKGVIATLPEKDRKRTAALVIETLKYKAVLKDIITASGLLKQERKIKSPNLALVLVHDLLLAPGGIQAGDGPIKQAVLRHKTRLHGELQRLKIKRGAKSNTELALSPDERVAQIPRYARVNTISWTTEEAIPYYVSKGYSLEESAVNNKTFCKDEHIADLLLFPSETSFHEDPNYIYGKLILQDKASCFPAVILDPPCGEDAVVIDATAAPGNKTSHLSALMHNTGKLYAFERNKKRYATLKHMLDKAGCRNVEALNLDFLAVDPKDPRFCMATHILLDPSCSGSGIINRLDHLMETEQEVEDRDEERLHKLAAFQKTMLKHAMTFPNVTRIVYSTCSVHAIENEHVVQATLDTKEAKVGKFTLAPQNEVLPTWQRRGQKGQLSDHNDAASLVRCVPGEDRTNGFFVACFVKPKESLARIGELKSSRAVTDEQHSNRPRKKQRLDSF
ncbi:S-adenosyl-L-methionine-dependent methyltransferase [Amanita rubescens]|nr:S-adenosyl-L-methionine-dependent methyltransferase [Amanita rubescens]